MSTDFRVRKELHIAAEPHVAVYAQNPTYTALDGFALIEAVKEEVCTASGRYYDRRIFRRRSRDNGQTWVEEPPLSEKSDEDFDAGGIGRTVPMHYLDPANGLLLSIHTEHEYAAMDTGYHGAKDLSARTQCLYYEISRDAGLTWEHKGRVVVSGDEYAETHWGPGLYCGRNGAQADIAPWAKLRDGTILCGVNVHPLGPDGELFSPHGGYFLETAFLRGRWRDDLSGIDWELGETLKVAPEQSSVGCCEPALALTGEDRLLCTMRCQGDAAHGIPSLKFSALSEDGGLTWSTPEPLRYDDGELVHSPASLAEFVQPSYGNEVYWIACISPEPVYAQVPRYPLCIGRFDAERLCLIRDSIRVIDDWHEGLPKDVRYTNWGSYEDRLSGEIVLTLPEEPRTSWEDLTSDCYRYRIEMGG